MSEKRWLTIHFTDNTEMRFDFVSQSIDPEILTAVVEKVTESNKLILEVEGVMYMFPYANIKYIRVSPCPEVLPETAIKGVHIASS